MARYILIDNGTGYVFGDTADFAGGANLTPIEAARKLDEDEVRAYGREYVEHGSGWKPGANQTAYYVYRADVDGSEAVPVVHDGQDPEYIEAVRTSCELVSVIETRDPDE